MSDALPEEVKFWAVLNVAIVAAGVAVREFGDALDVHMTKLDLAIGGNKARRRHLKRSGVQFARYLPGYGLVQFKRLANGLAVRV